MTEISDRLIDLARRFAEGDERRYLLVQVAAGHVGQTLDFLAIACDDIGAEEEKFLRLWSEQQARRRGKSGTWEMTAEEIERFVASRETGVRLQFRIHTFYTFARVLLDNIATLLDKALAPSPQQMGKHKGVLAHLVDIAAGRGLDASDALAKAHVADDPIKDYRDDYVIHRSAIKLRALEGFQIDESARTVRLSPGLLYPLEGEDLPIEATALPTEVMSLLDAYLEAVLDLIEPLVPSSKAS